ncbi:hypothetical protein N7447_011228 [Penicillium robsamsonii]|nr:hypothetical protein N7447_011228 [Penicillium robsamsonii]
MTTQAGVALSGNSPQRKPPAPAPPGMSRRQRPRPGPLPRAKLLYRRRCRGGSLFWLAGRRGITVRSAPPKGLPPSPSAGKACPFEPPFETRGEAVNQQRCPKLPIASPAEASALGSLRLNSPRPRQKARLQPTGKHLPPPNRRPQSLQWRRAHHVASVPPPLPAAPLPKAPAQALLSPSGARRHPPSRGQHAIPSLPWPLNQLAWQLAAQIRARARHPASPLKRPALPIQLMGKCKTNKSSQGRADAQRLVATKLLDRLHDRPIHFSRLQRIYPREVTLQSASQLSEGFSPGAVAQPAEVHG